MPSDTDGACKINFGNLSTYKSVDFHYQQSSWDHHLSHGGMIHNNAVVSLASIWFEGYLKYLFQNCCKFCWSLCSSIRQQKYWVYSSSMSQTGCKTLSWTDAIMQSLNILSTPGASRNFWIWLIDTVMTAQVTQIKSGNALVLASGSFGHVNKPSFVSWDCCILLSDSWRVASPALMWRACAFSAFKVQYSWVTLPLRSWSCSSTAKYYSCPRSV